MSRLSRSLVAAGLAAACLVVGPPSRAASGASQPTVPAPARTRLVLTAPQVAALGLITVPLGDREPIAVAGLAATVVVPPAQQRVVAAPVAGLLERVTVAVNDPVRAGQPIARLMSPGLAELQRGVVQAAVQARLADEVAARDRRLFDEGLVAESRLRASEAARSEAAAALAERRQALRLAGLSEATVARIEAGRAAEPGVDLIAPIDGVVLEQSVPMGSRVEAATALFRIARLAPLWLELQVPVDRVARVTTGDAVEVVGTAARGRVSSIGRGADAGQFVTVRAEVATGASALVPGQAVEARVLPGARGAGGWRVPTAAVARHDGRVLLFVQAADGFDAVPVRLLDEGDGGALVDGPLTAGERVAVRGTAALKAKLAGIGSD